MANQNRDVARETYTSQVLESRRQTRSNILNSYNALHTYDQLYPRRANVQPFYVEVVDREGKNVALPFPPVGKSELPESERKTQRQILGIKFLINPAALSLNMAKLVSRQQTMSGWHEDHWGEEIDTITFQGSTASFVIGSNNLRSVRMRADSVGASNEKTRSNLYASLGLDPVGVSEYQPGLTSYFRRKTVSYREFKKLIQLFQSNGCLFDPKGLVRKRKFIQVFYDYSLYRGYFESIDLTEDANAPFKFTYTVTFKSEKTIYSFPTNKTGGLS